MTWSSVFPMRSRSWHALDHRPSNARSEAINTYRQTLTKRAYGFHSPDTLIVMALVTRGGLCPSLPGRAAGNRTRGNVSRFARGDQPAETQATSGSRLSLLASIAFTGQRLGDQPRVNRAETLELGAQENIDKVHRCPEGGDVR